MQYLKKKIDVVIKRWNGSFSFHSVHASRTLFLKVTYGRIIKSVLPSAAWCSSADGSIGAGAEDGIVTIATTAL